jgi:hypothetical protein
MRYIYGEVRSQTGGIPVGGSDNSKLWVAFKAGDNFVQLINGSFWSGDSGEEYSLIALAPGVNTKVNGTATLSGSMGGIMYVAQLNAGHTQVDPGIIWPGRKTGGNTPPILPPHWTLYVLPVTAASTADFQVRILGVDLVTP